MVVRHVKPYQGACWQQRCGVGTSDAAIHYFAGKYDADPASLCYGAQMVQHEVARKELLDKQQRRVDEMEKRAEDLQRQKQENETQRMAKQREIELQKAREEQENERRARQLAEERYQHERKMQVSCTCGRRRWGALPSDKCILTSIC